MLSGLSGGGCSRSGLRDGLRCGTIIIVVVVFTATDVPLDDLVVWVSKRDTAEKCERRTCTAITIATIIRMITTMAKHIHLNRDRQNLSKEEFCGSTDLFFRAEMADFFASSVCLYLSVW
jgi:hypothetical protein